MKFLDEVMSSPEGQPAEKKHLELDLHSLKEVAFKLAMTDSLYLGLVIDS